MDFYEDEAERAFDYDDSWDEVYDEPDFGPNEGDVTLDTVELYGIPIYDVPEQFEPEAVLVLVKGYWPESDNPAIVFRASGNLSPYEIRGILVEGIKETL